MDTTNQGLRTSILRSVPVVLLIFLMACAQVGTVKSIGIYLKDISYSLGTTSTDIGFALGLFAAFSYFPAPLIAALYRLSWTRRPLLIGGSIFISLGVMLTALATDNALIAVYLSISGLGHCVVSISATIALSQMTSEHTFNLLFGFGMSGFGLGMVLLPLLAELLGEVYGWRAGILILGCLMANLVPCALAIRLPVAESRPVDQSLIYQELEHSEDFEESLVNNCSTEEEEIAPLCPRGADFNQAGVGESSICSSSVNRVKMESRKNETSAKRTLGKLRDSFYRSDFYRDPVFNFIFLTSVMLGIVYCGWHSFLVPHAFQRGYSVRATILMTFCASVGNFLGRLLAGALSGHLANPVTLCLGATLLNAFSILCDAFLQDYYVMIVTACISAICIAGISVLSPLSVKKRASSGSFDVAFAVNDLFFGLGTFFGGYLSGVVGGVFLSYDAIFKFLGGVQIVAFVLMLPYAVFEKPAEL
ncbi:monocarboxylate transporter 3-like [Lytechinus variegatus]|uniref:monocarboxylate transporter 3-like n=1 Tax=Lytechinus variegatus TaxID=7654 RepID=UPI001BB14F41|nr:monocarboxylate transporter 3-like [Lytechinus variegatus]